MILLHPALMIQSISKNHSKERNYTHSNKNARQTKTIQIKGLAVATRDLMGRLVIVATKRNLDLKHVFTYPLTPMPLSMCSPDFMMAKQNREEYPFQDARAEGTQHYQRKRMPALSMVSFFCM